MRLVSPALPIGAFAFSQGIESAAEHGDVHDEMSTRSWVLGVMVNGYGCLDLPIAARLYDSWCADNDTDIAYWNGYLHASRETAEFQSEDRRLAHALARVLVTLNIDRAALWRHREDASFAALFMLAASRWGISKQQAMTGMIWTWLENQVAAATRIIPLGQSQAQRILTSGIEVIPAILDRALNIDDNYIGSALPGWTMLSIKHEEQYSRLFQS